MLDGETFELKGNWENECDPPPRGCDFCLQPRHNVLVSSAGVVLKRAGYGFNPCDLKKGEETRTHVLSRISARWWAGGDAVRERGRAGFSPNGPSAASALATGRALPCPAPPYSSAVSRPILASRCRGCACPQRSGEGLVSLGSPLF